MARALLIGLLATLTVAVAPATARGGTSVSFGFRASAYDVRELPAAKLPYARTQPVPREDTGTHDATGVRMFSYNGRLYDHPVAQAQYGIALHESYRLTGDPVYLQRAILQAQRLLDRADEAGDALYFAYPFDFPLHGRQEWMLRAPWYSAMAQGQALSLFVRLALQTGLPIYRDAADGAYRSFLRPRGSSTPWTVFVDAGSYLWLEEYPYGTSAERALNGHVFAAFGLYDHWRLTHDTGARQLLRGALTTVAAYIGQFRGGTGRISAYCLAHAIRSSKYHFIHANQMLILWRITVSASFAQMADALIADYPPNAHGTGVLRPGSYTAYRFDARGAIVGTRSVRVASERRETVAARRTFVLRDGVWLWFASGDLAGWWLREGAGVHIRGVVSLGLHYDPLRPLAVAPGTHVVRRYRADGSVEATRTLDSRTERAHADRRAVINGIGHARLPDGFWLQLGPGVAFAP